MNYEPILAKIEYWKNYCGSGDEYRKAHDLDCILTNGNLFADTLFSLWLPLRYSLNFFEVPRWTYWKEFEQANLRKQRLCLKDYTPFLSELQRNIGSFLPEHEITDKLIQLFVLGQKRCNVILLPQRSWNSKRGCSPYFDYIPHFLYDALTETNTEIIEAWIRRENLHILFENGVIQKENICDLAGTGDVRCHTPREINLSMLLGNYVRLLELRKDILRLTA